jgi:hypothetical protein
MTVRSTSDPLLLLANARLAGYAKEVPSLREEAVTPRRETTFPSLNLPSFGYLPIAGRSKRGNYVFLLVPPFLSAGASTVN